MKESIKIIDDEKLYLGIEQMDTPFGVRHSGSLITLTQVHIDALQSGKTLLLDVEGEYVLSVKGETEKSAPKKWNQAFIGVAKTVVVLSIMSIAFAEYLRIDTINSFEKIGYDVEKVNHMMLRDYAMVGNSKTQLAIDQLIDQNSIKSLIEDERSKIKELHIALQPINYYRSPMNALLKLNDLSGITAQKLKVINLITKYKRVIAECQPNTKGV